MEKLEELVTLENQVKVVRLQDNLGKQSFQENMKKKHSNQLMIQLKIPLKN